MPSVSEKIEILGAASKYDVCASMASPRKKKGANRVGNPLPAGICHAYTSDGRCMSLFKVLMTNQCSFDCAYCMNSCGGAKKRTMFKPEELARIFMGLYIRNYVEGLFLSSGIRKDVDITSELMLEGIRLIRKRYMFRGYIHVKILPGTSYHLIKQITEIADRVSINLELPSSSRLSEVSSNKDFTNDLIKSQILCNERVKKGFLPAGQTTQFIVGSADESDREIFRRLVWEYENIDLKRGYFTAFTPVENTPLAKKEPGSFQREVQLYRIDWLFREYGYKADEILDIMNESDNVPLHADPKLLIAMKDDRLPVDVNEAEFDELMRVPGVGETSAKRIVNLREMKKKIRGYKDLQRVGVVVKRAKPFLIVNGKSEKMLISYF